MAFNYSLKRGIRSKDTIRKSKNNSMKLAYFLDVQTLDLLFDINY